MKNIIVFGNNNVAEMIYLETLKYNELYFAIKAFCVDDEYLNNNHFYDKPLLSLSEAVKKYPPQEYNMLSTALSSSCLRKRIEVFYRLKKLGYKLENYVSPLADISSDVQMGENNIILSLCRVGLGTKLGDANMLWYGVLLDHDSNAGNGNFLAGGCKTAGFVNIGNCCWIGLNSTIIQKINIADETLIGAGSVVIEDTEPYTVYVGNPAKAIKTHKDTGIAITV